MCGRDGRKRVGLLVPYIRKASFEFDAPTYDPISLNITEKHMLVALHRAFTHRMLEECREAQAPAQGAC